MGTMCCFKTLSAIGARDYVLKGIAYQPPPYKTYEIVEIEEDNI